jgi:hypothetical protein
MLIFKPFQREDFKVRSIPYLNKETLPLVSESLPIQCHMVEKFSILQNQSRAVSVKVQVREAEPKTNRNVFLRSQGYGN